MTTHRRDFLGWLGASGVMAAAGLPATLHATTDTLPRPVDDKWDMSWCDRVTGKVRAVFDSPEVSEGAGFWRAQLWRVQHVAVYGGAVTDASSVLVIRHEAIPLAMNDAYWARFEIGKELKLRDENGKKWAKANMIASAPPNAKGDAAMFNIPAFINSGGIVLACNLAFSDPVARYMKEDKLSKEDARKRAIENLIPGVILQPSGVFAVQRAQQAGCHYMLAS
jgi:hypothetical protein